MSFFGLMESFSQLTVCSIPISLGIILLLLLFVKNYGNTGKHLPPGPRGIPILGYAPFLKGRLEEVFLEIGKKYGDVFYLKLGADRVVVLNSFDAIKEALVKNANVFSGRPQRFNIMNHMHDYKGVAVENGSSWRIQRRFILSVLRDFGMGRQSVEHQIQLEAESIVKAIIKKNGVPFDIKYLLTNATSRMISSLTFGKRYEDGDHEFHRILNLILENFQSIQHRNTTIILPWIRTVPKLSSTKNFDHMKTNILEFIQKRIDEHTSTYDERNMRDFVDVYLKEYFQRLNASDTEIEPFDIPRLVANVVSLFIAGTISTAATLYWAIKFLVIHPEVQAKVHKELDAIIGRHRCPVTLDKDKMPYTDSFIMETQRFGDVVPVGVYRSTVASTTLNGYHIPEGTTVFANLHAVHYDKKLWGDPENFRPERFLGPDGKATRPEYHIPFQMGKRICIGETMARTELFLFLTTILQNFELISPEGATQTIDLEKRRARELMPFQICAISRRIIS